MVFTLFATSFIYIIPIYLPFIWSMVIPLCDLIRYLICIFAKFQTVTYVVNVVLYVLIHIIECCIESEWSMLLDMKRLTHIYNEMNNRRCWTDNILST